MRPPILATLPAETYKDDICGTHGSVGMFGIDRCLRAWIVRTGSYQQAGGTARSPGQAEATRLRHTAGGRPRDLHGHARRVVVARPAIPRAGPEIRRHRIGHG